MNETAERRRKNLAALVAEANGQAKLAAMLGRDRNQVWQWLLDQDKRAARAIGDKIAREIEQKTGKPSGWLDAINTPDSDEFVTVSTREIRAGYVRLPHYNADVSAGPGADMDASAFEVVEMLDVARRWADQNLPRDLSRVRVLSVRGDSMAPDMQHGDVLFVDTGSTAFDSPGLYVLNFQGRALVKRLVPELRTGRVALVSTNPAYPTEYVERGELDALHIGGRVAAWWTLRKY